jgi:A/G-specific adenine glycosylase
MLQQTQVITVIDYFNRWMKAFPNVEVLAHAHSEQVLKLWEGLGYYSRARNIHEASKMIVEHWKEDETVNWNRSLEEWRELKGVGPYTAGAIVSIALNRPSAIVDGNVERVYSRLYELKRKKSISEHQKQVWVLAEKFVSELKKIQEQKKQAPSAAQISQGWMELGALICTPKRPLCTQCPLQPFCLSFQNQSQSKYPMPKTKYKVKKLTENRALYYHKGKILLSAQSRWHKGLWDLPSLEELEANIKGPLKVKKNQLIRYETKYVVTHHQIARSTFLIEAKLKLKVPTELKWFDLKQLPPVSAPFRKVLKVYQDSHD